MELDREFLFELENCNNRNEIKEVLEKCDDDEASRMLLEHYEQILKFNKDETVQSIKNIIIFVYRKYCSEN